MLTELGGGAGGDKTAESPLSTLGGDYPSCIDSGVEFEYIESQLSDPYCGGSLQPPSPPPSPPTGAPSSCLPSLLYPSSAGTNTLNQPFLDCTTHYENDLVSLDRTTCHYEEEMKYNTDLTKYDQDLGSYDPELASYDRHNGSKSDRQDIGSYESDLTKYDSQDFGQYDEEFKYEDMLTETTSSCSPDLILPGTPQLMGSSDFSAGEYSPQETVESGAFGEDTSSPLPEENYVIGKGKVNDLQRTALDAIFHVTDRPSRNMVIHIASELRLHNVTVKNFFSNARRRVRRAAARLSDPERSRRENRRRKEKRKMAALAAAAAAAATTDGGTGGSCFQFPSSASLDGSGSLGGSGCGAGGLGGTSQKGTLSQSIGGEAQREPTAVSPQRRALMEKLADKVQRSAAQRNMAAFPEMTGGATSSSMSGEVFHALSVLNSSMNNAMTTTGGNLCSSLASGNLITDINGSDISGLTVNLGSPMTINLPNTMSGTITSNLPGYAPNSSIVSHFSDDTFDSGNSSAISCNISDPNMTCNMSDIIDTALSNSSISSLPNTASPVPVSPSLSPSSSSSCGGGGIVPSSDLLTTNSSWPQNFLGDNSMEYQQEPWELPNLY